MSDLWGLNITAGGKRKAFDPLDDYYFPGYDYGPAVDGELDDDEASQADMETAWLIGEGSTRRKPHIQRGIEQGPAHPDAPLTNTERWLQNTGHEFAKRIHQAEPNPDYLYRGMTVPPGWVDKARQDGSVTLPLSSFSVDPSLAYDYSRPDPGRSWAPRSGHSVILRVEPGSKSHPIADDEDVSHGDFDVLDAHPMSGDELVNEYAGSPKNHLPTTVLHVRQRSVPEPVNTDGIRWGLHTAADVPQFGHQLPHVGPMEGADWENNDGVVDNEWADGGCAHLALAFKNRWPDLKIGAEIGNRNGQDQIYHAWVHDGKNAHDVYGTHKNDPEANALGDGKIDLDVDPQRLADLQGVRWSPDEPWADRRVLRASDEIDRHWLGSARSSPTASTDGIRYAHVVEADVAEDLMRLSYRFDSPEHVTVTRHSGAEIPGLAQEVWDQDGPAVLYGALKNVGRDEHAYVARDPEGTIHGVALGSFSTDQLGADFDSDDSYSNYLELNHIYTSLKAPPGTGNRIMQDVARHGIETGHHLMVNGAMPHTTGYYNQLGVSEWGGDRSQIGFWNNASQHALVAGDSIPGTEYPVRYDHELYEPVPRASRLPGSARQHTAMPQPMPEGIHFTPFERGDETSRLIQNTYPDITWEPGPGIAAHLPGHSAPVGHIEWLSDDDADEAEQYGEPPVNPGEVAYINVDDGLRRHSIGTELFDQARKHEPRVHHSEDRTELGEKWIGYEQSRHPVMARRIAMPQPLPKGVFFRYHPELMWSPGVTAHLPGGKQVGSLEWYDDDHVMVDLGTRKPGEIDRISVHPDHQGNSIATSMFDFAKQYEPRLHHSDQLTDDGRGWSEYEKARHAAVTQDLVDRLRSEFKDWHRQQPKGSIFGGGIIGGLDQWPNIEAFLKDRYPAAHRGLSMGHEEAGTLLDDKPNKLWRDYPDYEEQHPLGYAADDPYETGPEAEAKHGYDPKEIAAAMLLLHNKTDRFRGDMSQEDQARLNDIAQKRYKMQRDYEQRNARLAMAWQDWAPQIQGGCKSCTHKDDGNGSHGEYWIKHEPNGDPLPGDALADGSLISNLSFFHDVGRDGVPELYIAGIHTSSGHRNDGVAEALMRRMHEDHPNTRINPGFMTEDGQAFHDKMMQKEPDARGVVTAGLNGELPENLTFQYHAPGFEPFPDVIQPNIDISNSWPTVTAHDGDRMVGHIQWDDDHPRKKGEIWDLRVHPDYQRRGIGTALFDWTTDKIEPDLHHSNNLSDEGRAFAEAEVARPLADERYEAWRNGQPMPKRFAGRNGPPPPMTFEPFNTMWTNGIMARHAEDGRPLAHLHWYPDGEIETIRVHPELRGRDIAKHVLAHAAMNPDTYEAKWGIHPSNHLTPEGRAFAKSLGHNPSDTEVTPAEGEDQWQWKAVENYVPLHVPYTGQNEDEMSRYLEQPWQPPNRTASAEDDGWPVWWRGRHRPAGPFDKRWHPNHPEHIPAPWDN